MRLRRSYPKNTRVDFDNSCPACGSVRKWENNECFGCTREPVPARVPRGKSANRKPTNPTHPCMDCGVNPTTGKRCRPCNGLHISRLKAAQRVAPPDDEPEAIPEQDNVIELPVPAEPVIMSRAKVFSAAMRGVRYEDEPYALRYRV